MCVIRKKTPGMNVVGKRVFTGNDDTIIKKPTCDHLLVLSPQNQKSNRWSTLEISPDENYFELIESVKSLTQELNDIHKSKSWKITAPLRDFARVVRKLKS